MPVTSAATSITRKKIPTTKRVVTAVPANSPSDRKRRRFNCDGRTEKETKTGEVEASSGRGSASTASSFESAPIDRKSTRLNSSHSQISYAVFCLKKKKKQHHSRVVIHELR